nr:MAG TPA: hypothetical protein [Caudoviricetes sp.]
MPLFFENVAPAPIRLKFHHVAHTFAVNRRIPEISVVNGIAVCRAWQIGQVPKFYDFDSHFLTSACLLVTFVKLGMSYEIDIITPDKPPRVVNILERFTLRHKPGRQIIRHRIFHRLTLDLIPISSVRLAIHDSMARARVNASDMHVRHKARPIINAPRPQCRNPQRRDDHMPHRRRHTSSGIGLN